MKKLLIAAIMILLTVGSVRADVVEMTKRTGNVIGYEYAETIADGLTGDDVHIYATGLDGSKIVCTLITGAGTGRVEFTTSLDSAIVAETAVWQPWDLGDVTGTYSDDVSSKIKGLRAVSVSGEVTIEISY